METADILTMVLFGLIVAVCWIAAPGLIAGWVLRERGGSFKSGFALGALFGPLGVLAAGVCILFADWRNRRRPSAQIRRQRPRTHYAVPILGRLHASTTWMLAGLATFLCAWMLGGIGFELFYHRPLGDDGGRISRLTRKSAMPAQGGTQTNAAPPTPKPAPLVKSETETQPRSSMLGAITSQPSQPGQLTASASPVTTQSEQTTSLQRIELTSVTPLPQPTAQPQANTGTTQANVAPAQPKPAATGRAAIISELTGTLGARGYRAHATVSGDARTSTLSISCATLTRAAGNQLLSNGRTREALKAAGIRIVVMINGHESWTYML